MCDSVHACKIPHYERQIEDGAVAPACVAKAGGVPFRAGPGLSRKFDGEIQQVTFGFRDGGGGVVLDDRFDELIIARYTAETLRVLVDSIMALVDNRNDHGDGLALRPAKLGRSKHHCAIQVVVGS